MKITVTEKHMQTGRKGCPSRNPISLAVKEALDTNARLIHVLVSHDGLLQLWDNDMNTIFSDYLGDVVTHFFDMWYVGMEPEVPFNVDIPDFLRNA